MEYVVVEYKAPTLDEVQMPLYFYSMPLRIVEETNESICVAYEGDAFWFDKKYIKMYSH